MEEHSGFLCHSVLSPVAMHIFNCHLWPALRFILYVFLCGGARSHLICHNSECPAGLCTTVALHHPPLLTALSTGRISLLNKDTRGFQWLTKIILYFGLINTTQHCKTEHTCAYFGQPNKSNCFPLKLALHVSVSIQTWQHLQI